MAQTPASPFVGDTVGSLDPSRNSSFFNVTDRTTVVGKDEVDVNPVDTGITYQTHLPRQLQSGLLSDALLSDPRNTVDHLPFPSRRRQSLRSRTGRTVDD